MALERTASPPTAWGGPHLDILYEHPDWFRPLFAELDRRGVPYRAIDARTASWDPAYAADGSVLFNRMSPSAWLRDAGSAVFATADILARAEAHGIRVINGSRAWATEISKGYQLDLLRRAGLRAPVSRVVQRTSDVVEAAKDLHFPVVTKPNVGGSGAGVVQWDDLESLAEAARSGSISFGLTGVGVVQEAFRSDDGAIQRVEVLDGKVLYGIRVISPEGEFNLCPADACQTTNGVELNRAACALDAADQGLKVERFEPSAEVVREVEQIAALADIEIGGVEYVEDIRTGERLYYDVNALSNFVADGEAVLGFDPFAKLADWLESELTAASGADVPVGTASAVGGGL